MPNAALFGLSHNPHISHIALDRAIVGTMERTGAAIGATAIRQEFGYDDPGWHRRHRFGYHVVARRSDRRRESQRVDSFVDFVNGRDTAYDDYGHGTHVAGIIAGNGMDSSGARSGIAPNARLIVLKALDGTGRGRVSDVIAAMHYVLVNKEALNIRVVNMSVATGVYSRTTTIR